jgi:tetratricopeptide (TPR) repeat protein
MDPNNSDFHMWLGRALGEKADKASFVSAYSLAKRALAEFQNAVQLNPRNAEALADLGEFYDLAPGVVGGGTDKAQSVATELERVDPARAHELLASIAMSNHDYAGTEREFKEAVAVSKHPAFQWMRLASFYRQTKQWPQMDSAVRAGYAAAQKDRTSAVALFNGASVLIEANRDLEMAKKLLQAYLASPGQTEEAPAFVAHVWLARLLAQSGDISGAQRERQEALSLANSYKPAQNLKF